MASQESEWRFFVAFSLKSKEDDRLLLLHFRINTLEVGNSDFTITNVIKYCKYKRIIDCTREPAAKNARTQQSSKNTCCKYGILQVDESSSSCAGSKFI